MKKYFTLALLGLSLTGCVTFPTADSRHVQVIWDDTQAIQGCELKGTVLVRKVTSTITGCMLTVTWYGVR
ncbi:hypothetical protein JCM19237_4822 [Photobacterium aphoticum]|uniref:Lipoprotein n=1 Tax=Photobacterium aphoticum TaxID=754436 RepID=A0A090QV60_9GAMM|nr:hypothetical protein JCM19237_4822 [Photobacterium aphoticum]